MADTVSPVALRNASGWAADPGVPEPFQQLEPQPLLCCLKSAAGWDGQGRGWASSPFYWGDLEELLSCLRQNVFFQGAPGCSACCLWKLRVGCLPGSLAVAPMRQEGARCPVVVAGEERRPGEVSGLHGRSVGVRQTRGIQKRK